MTQIGLALSGGGFRATLYHLGLVRFQPSEIMKLAVPMMCAWYLHQRPLPPSFRDVAVVLLIVALGAATVSAPREMIPRGGGACGTGEILTG